MRLSLAVGVAVVLLYAAAAHAMHARDSPLLTEEFAAHVNTLTGGTWKASHENGPLLKGMTLRETKRLMGALPGGDTLLSKRRFTAEEALTDLPDSFEAAERWPDCPTITTIADQSACGSCWAVAAASAMSDRHCTIGGVRDVQISAGDLMACCANCGFGCSGGYPAAAWAYYAENGIASDYCQPYPFPRCAHHTESNKYPQCPNATYPTPICNATCTNKEIPIIKYKGNQSYTLTGEDDFKRELYLRGPIEVTLTVYADFMTYKSGVYQHVTGKPLGGHAVRLIGWGELNGVPYWKVANSWNEEWGANGYVLVLRGKDECGIESGGTAGTPEIPASAP